ncbi:MAG: hypothetical protein CVU64_10310 [Deltaproteobacteria bacterium HGW-Deltaproteobacteria-21]|nr:MAG: hypothetical protein CVU64_10310 [Deltaproteobacteria bacterium HGW-Deltaproteobacteria-21]
MVHVKKFRVWLCIAVYILAVGSAQGAVLCVGTGGHAHIEMESAGCDQASAADAQPFGLHSSMAPAFSCDIEQCTPCEHIPLFTGTPEHLSAQSDFPVDLPLLGPPSPDAVPMFPGILDKTGALSALPAGSSAPALLRSVILLI